MKKYYILPLLLILVFQVFGNGQSDQTDMSETNISSNYPLTIQDYTNESLTLLSKPERIVSVTLMTDEILFDMVETDRLLAITTTAENPDISNVSTQAEQVEQHINMNAEVILSLNPDLVFAADWSDQSAVSLIRSAGIPVYLIKSPVNLDEVSVLIENMGILTDEKEKADSINLFIEDERKTVKQALLGLEEEDKLSILEYTPFGNGGGLNSSWDFLVNEAGLINGAAAFTSDQWGYVNLSKESLLVIDPDLLCLPAWIWGDPAGAEAFKDQIITDPALSSMKAVLNENVFSIPERYKSATSQYMVLGLKELAEAAYPELFKD